MNCAISRRHRGALLRAATLCVAAAVSLNTRAQDLTFEQVFSEKGEPAVLHYKATFTSKGAEHRLEVWRDGERRVKRRTDDAIETYAFRQPGDAEFQMSVLDLQRRIHTRIDRTNLYRIGGIIDWFDLTHGLRHPTSAYRVVKARGHNAAKAISTCRWYDLVEGQQTTHICWSEQNHLPLLIQAQDGHVVWRIVAIDRRPIPANAFQIRDEGFVRVDADEDVEND